MSHKVNDKAWMVAGIQHAVLLRALPVVRHDLAGPISVLRMGAIVLKRRLTLGDLPAAEAVERVEQLESHLAELSELARRLRHWDRITTEAVSAQATVNEAISMAKPLLGARGVQVEPLSERGVMVTSTRHQALLQVVLASLYYLTEQPDVLPSLIAVTLESDAITIKMSITSKNEPIIELASQQGPIIDVAALEVLALHWKFDIKITSDSVRITLTNA